MVCGRAKLPCEGNAWGVCTRKLWKDADTCLKGRKRGKCIRGRKMEGEKMEGLLQGVRRGERNGEDAREEGEIMEGRSGEMVKWKEERIERRVGDGGNETGFYGECGRGVLIITRCKW